MPRPTAFVRIAFAVTSPVFASIRVTVRSSAFVTP
jgi:hypothetical protein